MTGPRRLPLFVTLLASLGSSTATCVSAQPAVAIVHATVIDGASPAPRVDQTVVVRGTRIVSVGASAATALPRGARVIQGRGKFVVPGLWDMHVHTAIAGGRPLLALYVANGVTGVRDMAGDWDTLRTWRSEIARGALVGPRIVASGPYLEGGDVPIPHLLARNTAEARIGVDSLIALGVDFIKVHSQLNAESYFAIARRARERGVVFAGHVPRTVGAAAASDSGQKSIEHMLTIPVPCTEHDSIALVPRFTVQAALGRCTTEDLAPLYAKLVRNGTYVTPTFTAMVEVASWPSRSVPGDTLAHYLPQAVRDYVAQIFPMPDSIPPNADSVGRALMAKRLQQAEAMRRAGVRVMTGTDAPLRNSPPGFGLLEEMTLLANGGMSPMNVLKAATIEPARYLGMLDSAGTVAPGKVADLVVLTANPLADIRNVRRIAAVIANGRVFAGADRERLLHAGEATP